ncbi:MAG: BBE domain-containing protein [Anaerobacillus sp.]
MKSHAYYVRNFDRHQLVKAKNDSNNIFCFPQSIPPAY